MAQPIVFPMDLLEPVGVVTDVAVKKCGEHNVCFASVKVYDGKVVANMSTGVSVLQEKCEDVACQAWGVTREDLRQRGATSEATADNKAVDWASLLAFAKALAETIASIMGNCPQANKAALVRSLRSPNWLQKVRFKAELRNRCATCVSPEARHKFDEGGDLAFQIGASLSVAEAESLVDECREPLIDHSV
jgi:hypothetical protein